MYFEDCSCSICLDIQPDEQKVKEISLEYIAAKYPKNCEGENLINYLKSLITTSLILSTITLACEHKFHLKCLLPLMKGDKETVKCPNCRRESSVRASRDYDVIKSLKIITFFDRVLKQRISSCKIENPQKLFPLSKIQQNDLISAEKAEAIHQAFIHFKRSLFQIAEQQTRHRSGMKLNFSDLELDDYVKQIYFTTKDGRNLTL